MSTAIAPRTSDDLALGLSRVEGLEVARNRSLAALTSWGVGGAADVFVLVHREDAVGALVHMCREREVPLFVLGAGSNVLVSDDGFRGVVARLGSEFSTYTVEGTRVICGALASMPAVARHTASLGLTGFEWAAGIPGSMGGGAWMNAGAFGVNFDAVLDSVAGVTADGEFVTRLRSEMQPSYRHADLGAIAWVTRVTLGLSECDARESVATLERMSLQRLRTQPTRERSAGCVFRNAEGVSAGKLIDTLGLKGEASQFGEASVSYVHGNFMINHGKATSREVWDLIWHVHDQVLAQGGVDLHLEVVTLGAFSAQGGAR